MLDNINLPPCTHFVQVKVYQIFMNADENPRYQTKVGVFDDDKFMADQLIHCVRIYSSSQENGHMIPLIVYRICDLVKSLFGCSTWQKSSAALENLIFKKTPIEAYAVLRDTIKAKAEEWIKKLIKLNDSKQEFSAEQIQSLMKLGQPTMDRLSREVDKKINLKPEQMMPATVSKVLFVDSTSPFIDDFMDTPLKEENKIVENKEGNFSDMLRVIIEKNSEPNNETQLTNPLIPLVTVFTPEPTPNKMTHSRSRSWSESPTFFTPN